VINPKKKTEIIHDNWKKAQEEKIYGKHWEYTIFLICNVAFKRGKELSKEKRMKLEKILKDTISFYENNKIN